MPAQTINMHGKVYSLFDEKIRNKEQAKSEASDIRENGQVAFLNPRKRKDLETTYYIYVAEKAVRVKKPTQKEVIQELDNQSDLTTDEIDELIDGEIESDIKEATEALQELADGEKICPVCNTVFKPKNSRQIYDKKACSKIARANNKSK